MQSPLPFDVIQTFYIDPEAVNGAPEVFLSSVELFFKTKPSAKNVSGASEPGVVVSICEVINNSPDVTKTISKSIVRKEYNSIYAYSDGSVATIFALPTPVVLKSDRTYGIVVVYEDQGFDLWTNVLGDKLVGTNTPSTGAADLRGGFYYSAKNDNFNYSPLGNVDLKFKVNIAKFINNGYSATVELVNKDYEFFTLSERIGSFYGGEFVYKDVEDVANQTISVQAGNTTIIGTSTLFDSYSPGDYLIISTDPVGDIDIVQIEAIISDTEIRTVTPTFITDIAARFKRTVVGKVFYVDEVKNKLYLTDSTASPTLYFADGDVLRGVTTGASAVIQSIDNFSVDMFVPNMQIKTQSGSRVDASYSFAYDDGVTWRAAQQTPLKLKKTNEIRDYDGYILSRSKEVIENTYLHGPDAANKKSAFATIDLSVVTTPKNLFYAPYIQGLDLDVFSIQNKVSNTTSHIQVVNGVEYDTEIERNGLAESKHISSKIYFANNRFAEDARVFLTGYRPKGTDILVYAKVHNSADPEPFDDKVWTPMVVIENESKYSSSADTNDMVEFTYALPEYPEALETLNGNYTAANNTSYITIGAAPANTADQPNNKLEVGDLVKIYDPLYTDRVFVTTVTSANSSAIGIGKKFDSSDPKATDENYIGKWLRVDKLKYRFIAFNDKLGDGIATYYSGTAQGVAGAQYDKFDGIQIKIVLLADNTFIVPKVDKVEVIGVSV